jgi:aminoglycoside phosphotransferase (APT) family kinase protein/putative sterol carrier protein
LLSARSIQQHQSANLLQKNEKEDLKMTGQKQELTDIASKLTSWLGEKMPHASNLSISDLDKPGMGLSSETIIFNLHWDEARNEKSKGIVLRAAPLEHKVFPDYDLGYQFRIMDALKDTNVPVAKMLWLEEDPSVIGVPFFLMERLEGEVPQDFPSYHSSGVFYEAKPEERAKMWWGSFEAMVNIHKLDWKDLGLSFLGAPKGGTDPIDLQLAYWDRFFKWAKDDPKESHPILEASLKWLKENRYETERVSLCWGDARMGNTLYSKPHRDVLAVMDWEMAYIGDPESDLAWFFLLDRQHSLGVGLPRLEGTPSYEESVKRYEDLTGWKVKNLFYNEVLSSTRYGMILVSVLKKFKQQGIPIQEDMIHNNVCTQRLSELLDLPSPGPKKTEISDIKDITVTVQFHLTGPGGLDWYLLSDKGMGTRHEGAVDNPTCTITATADDWRAIQSGKLDRMDAWSSGRLVVDGDMNVMLQLEDLISEFTNAESLS